MAEVGPVPLVYSTKTGGMGCGPILLKVRCCSETENVCASATGMEGSENCGYGEKPVKNNCLEEDVVVSSDFSKNISIQTFSSGATFIHIKDGFPASFSSQDGEDSDSAIEDKEEELEEDCNLSHFGKRSGNSNRRPNDCLVLEQSEMIVIDYPDVQSVGVPGQLDFQRNANRKAIQSMNLENVVLGSPGVSGIGPTFGSRPQPTLSSSASSSSSTVSGSGGGSSATTPTSSLMRPQGNYQKDCMDTRTRSRSCNNKAASEQMREVETVIHKSEVCLGGGKSGHSSFQQHNGAPGLRRITENSTRSTRSSTSSAYSGSTDQVTPSNSVVEGEEDLAGLPEANVDSDEDDDESCPSGDSFMELRDNVRDCLEKGPEERTEDDLIVLLDFMQHMPAFSNLPMTVKRELCWKMVFAIVEKAGRVVMQDGEQLDSWCVIVNGEVEVILPDGQRVEYRLGDSFGVEPRTEPQFNKGVMRTLVDDCQFVLITQEDYLGIMSKVAENLQKHTDAAGEIVSETERRIVDNRDGYVVIKARPDKLMTYLVEEGDSAIDPYFVEDLLLMYRVFIHDPVTIFEKLMYWFADSSLRDKVARLVLLWVNNHFNDFETSAEMMKMLESFAQALERENMRNHQALLNIACSVKSRTRTVTYTRSNKEEILHFSILGGYDQGSGIFVSSVESDSKADKVGLKRGDEILEVNGQNFQHLHHQRALDILRGATHLSITVKSNLLGFKEMLSAPDKSEVTTCNSKTSKSLKKAETQVKLNPLHQPHLQRAPHSAIFDQRMGTTPQPTSPGAGKTSFDSGRTGKLSKLLAKLRQGTSGSVAFSESEEIYDDVSLDPKGGALLQRVQGLKPSRSNPDISEHGVHGISGGISQYYQPLKTNAPEHVLKVYRSDQTFKYLTVYKTTDARNVVQLALQEFGMAETTTSNDWILSEATVTPERIIKQRSLPDQIQNLAERIALNSRYYLKNKSRSDALIPDDLAPEVLKEAQIQFLQLNASIIAAQLTLQDFAIFASIGIIHKLRDTCSQDLQLLLDPSRNMSKYRQHLAAMAEDPPVVPLYPVIKKDLTFIHDGNSTWTEGLVNFEKLRMIAKEVRAVSKLGSAPYELTAMFEHGGGGKLNDALIHMNTFVDGVSGNSVATMRKQTQPRPALPRKKVYEQALMVRKVKSYLSSLNVIDSESELDRLSVECEPQVGSGSVGKELNNRKRMPSPSPSSSSSMSNTSDQNRRFNPKFGIESPQAVQKMFSLVECSKPVKLSASASSAQRGLSGRISCAVAPTGPMIPGSPNPSPCPPRRSNRGNRIPSTSSSSSGHGRSQSEGVSSVPPVDLTAESSCITTLLAPGARISSTGSVTSTDSVVSQHSVPSLNISHAISCDSTDSGHASMDTHSNSSQPASPPSQRRSYPPNLNNQHQPASHADTHRLKNSRIIPTTGAHMSHRPSPAYFHHSISVGSPGNRSSKSKAPPPPAASAVYAASHAQALGQKQQKFNHVTQTVRRTNSVPGDNNEASSGEQISRV